MKVAPGRAAVGRRRGMENRLHPRAARAELRAEVGALAVQIAERLIQKSLRDEDHQRLVQEALARMDSK